MFDYKKDFRDDMVKRAQNERKIHSVTARMSVTEALMAVYKELRDLKEMMSAHDNTATFNVTERDEQGRIKSFRLGGE
jgi:hypothetical protein